MPTYVEIANQFGDLIAKSDYEAAHALLTKEAQAVHTPEELKEAGEKHSRLRAGPDTER